MKRSLTLRIFFVQFLCMALVLMVTTCIFFKQFYTKSLQVLKEQLEAKSVHVSFAISGLEPLPSNALQDILLFLPKDFSSVKKDIIALNTLDSKAGFSLITLTEEEGSSFVVHGDLAKVMQVFNDNEDIEHILQTGRGSFIRYLSTPSLPTSLYYFVGSVLDLQERQRVVLLAASNITESTRRTFQQESQGKLFVALTNTEGVVLASSLSALEGQYFQPLTSQMKQHLEQSGALGYIKLADLPIKQKKEEGFTEFLFKGKTYLAYEIQSSQQGYGLISFTPKSQVFFATLQHFFWIYFIYALVLMIGVMLAYYLAWWLSKPLRQLTFVMGKAQAGDLGARCREVPLGFEFNLLGQLFNKTIEGLLKNIQQAEDAKVQRETYHKEISIGREVQKSLLTMQVADKERVDIFATYLQAENVGGDFYCVEQLADGRYLLLLGDAAGKGISSCLYALVVRSLVRSYATLHRTLEKILCETNNAFLESASDSGMFVAAIAGTYDPLTQQLTYYSCGHTPGIVKKKDGSLEILQHSGMALGLLELNEINVNHITLEEGDLILFFTKGLIEGVNEKHQYFSEKRLKELLQQRKWLSPKELVEGLVDEYKAFIGNMLQEDEVVIMAMQAKSRAV